MYRTLFVLLALTLAALLFGAASARPGATVTMEHPDSGRYLVGFNSSVELNQTDVYRWSLGGSSALFLYGFDGWPVLLDMRLSSARPPAAPAAETRLASNGEPLATFTVGEQWRHYRLLLPSTSANERAVLLETPTFVPGKDDPRRLGVALNSFTARVPQQQAEGAGWYLPGAHRLAFLLFFPLLVYLAAAQWLPAWGSSTRPWLHLPAMAVFAGALALVALAAAFPWWGGYMLPTMWPLLLLFGAAAVLPMVWRWLAAERLEQWLARPQRSGAVPRVWLVGGALLVGLAGLVLLRALPAPREGLPLLVGLLLAGGGALAALAMMPSDVAQGETVGEDVPVRRGEVLLLVGIVLVSAALRLWQLDSLPMGLWRDEARHGLVALRILDNPDYRPVYVPHKAGLPAFFFYLIAPLIGLFGPHVWTLRIVPALVGVVVPLALWWCFRPMFGHRAALLAAWLLAVASWSVSLSRWGYPVTLDYLFVLLSIGLMWRALPYGAVQPGDRSPRPYPPATRRVLLGAVLLMMGSALFAGMGFYTYYTGRFAPLTISVLTVARLGWSWARWRFYFPALAAAFLVGLLTVAPLLSYIAENPASYNRRASAVAFWNENDRETHAPASLFLRNATHQLGIWHAQGDNNGRFHTPYLPALDPISGLLMLVGLALLWRSRRWKTERLVIFLWLGVGLLPGLLSADAPHTVRSGGTMVPSLVAAAIGMAAVLALPWKQRARSVLVAVFVLVPFALNVGVYFGAMPRDPAVYGEFYVTETHIGQTFRALAESPDPAVRQAQVFSTDGVLENEVAEFLLHGLAPGTYDDEEHELFPPPGPSALLLLPGDSSTEKQRAALDLLGPGAVALENKPTYPDGTPTLHAFARGADVVAWWSTRYARGTPAAPAAQGTAE
jgi:4-amino-4-deoxy-L-arabinose transferase-like glycosyltransferase